MKKSRIIALLTAVAMIMSIVPAFAADMSSASYIVTDDGIVLEKTGDNLVQNPGFEEGLTGIAGSSDYYAVSEQQAHSGSYSLQALQSTKESNALSAAFSVSDPSDIYYLSFWYLNTDTVARRPRVTFAFTSSIATPPTDEDFIDETNSWVAAGTASNDQGMSYSKGEWVQYSAIITGNGNAVECGKVILQIYGLAKNVSYVDDIEVYKLSDSAYNEKFSAALAEWESNSVPQGPLAGIGTLTLTREINSVSGVSVEWSSSSECVDAETGDYVSGAASSRAVLTARIYIDGFYDEIYKEYEYAFIVKSMFDPYIDLINADFDSFGASVKSDLKFDTEKSVENYYPATIAWECSDPDVIAPDGTFTAPEITKYVDLSAVITCNGDSYTVSRRIKALGGNIVPDGLVMYYDFESGISKNTIEDVSGNGNTATSTSGVTVADGYAYFNGIDSAITLPTDYGTKLPGNYSVSMWVKLDKSIASSAAMYRFFDFGGDSYSSQFLRYVPATGQLSFMDRGTASSGSDWALDTTLPGIADTWKLVTLTYSFSSQGSNAMVYIDGNIYTPSTGSALTRSIATVAGASSITGYIGRTQWNNADNPDYKGYIDDVRIYNRVLTYDEIRTLYTETRPTVTANVTVKYVDTEGNPLFDGDGNLLAEDVVVQYDVDSTYDVPSSLKSVSSYSDDTYRYSYKYIASKSDDSVYVTTSGENVCTLVFELTKSVKDTNLIENGSFEDGTTTGWTNRLGTAITGATVEYDSEIGANVMSIKTLGKSDTASIGTIWKVEKGKEYTLSFDIGGAKPEEGNYQYNKISDSYNNNGNYELAGNILVEFGEEMNNGAWTHFEKTFTAKTDTVYIQSSWAAGVMKFANFSLKEVTEGGGDTPEEPGVENGIPVIIKYQDPEGNKIKDDVTVYVSQETKTYTVPASYKASYVESDYKNNYIYTYNSELSDDEVTVSILVDLLDNVCTLVFDLEVRSRTENIVSNSSFENGTVGWTNRLGTEITGATVEYDAEIGANVMSIQTLGKSDTASIGTIWKVVPGRTYTLSFDLGGAKPEEGNYGYNRISDGYNYVEGHYENAGNDLVNFGEEMNDGEWTHFEKTFVAQTDTVYLQSSWASGKMKFANFSLQEVVQFENYMTYEDGKVSIYALEGTTGYLVQAFYDEEGALTKVTISEKMEFDTEVATVVDVTEGAKLILVKDLTSLEPICPSVEAK